MSMTVHDARRWNRLLVVFAAAALLLGGASSAGLPANALLQLAGAAFIAATLASEPGALVPGSRLLRILALVLAAIALLQFFPLPFSLWRVLPGREMVAAGLVTIGAPQGWQTLSFAPWSGFASIVWLLPAAGLAAGAARATTIPLRPLAQTVVGIALLSVLVALFQRFGNQVYFYEVTNSGQGVGFFANANHQATFLLAAILLWSALRVDVQGTRDRRRDWLGARAVHAAIIVTLLFGIWMTGSAAGAGLALVALAGSVLLHTPELRLNWRLVALAMLAAMLAVAALYLTGVFAENLGDKATGANLNRLVFYRTGIEMIGATFPFGSGIGTFADYYHWFEDLRSVSPTFVNHAHNDLLEVAIETGLPGIAAMLLFAAWWLERARAILARRRTSPYPLAALMVVGVIAAHSAVDYPLRTAAVASLFALCCVIVQRNPAKEARQVPTLESGPMVIRRI